jgi:DNA-binding beta-propeller fold protein YncE
MRIPRKPTPLAVCLAIMLVASLAASAASVATAAPLPNRLLLSSHFGWEVDQTQVEAGAPQAQRNRCTAASHDICQSGRESSAAGGFLYPSAIAVSRETGDVYVLESVNHRVQELGPQGEFLAMFGWEVDLTKVQAAASQSERNICTAASKDVCQAGVEGAAAGQIGPAVSGIAVDPASGAVYVAESFFGESAGEFAIGQRVQEFTAAGKFVLELGKEVNATTKGNLCTEEEVEKAGRGCAGPALRTPAAAATDSEHGAFDFEGERDVLAAGGPQGLLYVGEQGRVQEFKASGEWTGEISLAALSATGRASAVAVDPAGEVFVADTEAAGVHEYSAAGQLQAQTVEVTGPAHPNAQVESFALDPHGRLGIVAGEYVGGVGFENLGLLYSATGGKLSEFAPPSGSLAQPGGLAFAASGELYVLETTSQEVEAYAPVVFPETQTCAALEVTATSAKLCGEIDPDGVPSGGFFQYGTSQALGSQTALVFQGAGEAPVPVSLQLSGLEPNQVYRYRLAAEAQVEGETLQGHGEEVTFHTAAVPPQIVGEASASFVKAESAVLSASLNPEHLATLYRFEYGACPVLAGCATVQSTSEEESSQYGAVGSTQEIRGLAPLTTYRYRLVASNQTEVEGKTIGGEAVGPEGSFTTGSPPTLQATTGAASAVTPTSAVISGSVDPDGQPATYTFELGVYAGAATQYGVVLSGPTGAETTSVGETLALSGLQPGATYAYRILVRSGYGEALGAPATFTTPGLPSVLTAPAPTALLATPSIAFPKPAPVSHAGKAKRKQARKKHAHKRKHAGKVRRVARRELHP